MKDLNVEQILNMYNYFDGAIITDETGKILYYTNFRRDLFDLKINPVGKTILEVHPYLTEETSSIMRVLKTGKPIYNHIEHIKSTLGQDLTNIYSTLPVVRDEQVVGAVDLFRCIGGPEVQRNSIDISGAKNRNNLYHLSDIITTSAEMKEVKRLIPMAANMDSAVMIYGETGTGKEMIAQSLHSSGNRADRPFISQNCAAIPATLLESILFGTVKGAYTGAEDRSGLFELADGGTLFLDEVNSMEMAMQAKILKAIEEKSAPRVGENKPRSFDVKIVSAVNREPYSCVQEKKLREDLFYRLNTVQITIPPLRDRMADIEYLTEHFIATYNSKMNKNVLGVSPQVEEIFHRYNWPGNVRELKNVIEGAFNIIGSRFIQPEHLPQYLLRRLEKTPTPALAVRKGENLSLTARVDDYEKQLILQVLERSKNVSAAAQVLKISKQRLHYKMEKYGIKFEKESKG